MMGPMLMWVYDGSVSQIYFGMACAVFSGRFYCRLQPYRTRYQNWLAELSMWQLAFMFLCSLMIKVN